MRQARKDNVRSIVEENCKDDAMHPQILVSLIGRRNLFLSSIHDKATELSATYFMLGRLEILLNAFSKMTRQAFLTLPF